MCRIFLIIVSLFISISAYAQYELKGKLANTKGEPIEHAVVRAFLNDSFIKGTTSDSLGKYSIVFEHNGVYKVEFNALGYKPLTITAGVQVPVLEAPLLTLQDTTATLKNVTVIGRQMTRVDNHYLIIPDLTSVKHSFFGYQLLENLNLPGFDVQPHAGVVQLFGKNVSLYIDGEPADYNMVKNLRSKDIAKLEYHDVPTGRYSQDYAAINFITKKFEFGGYANLMAQQNIGHLNGTYEGYTQMAINETKLHVMGGYTMWDMARDSYSTSETYNFAENPVVRDDKNQGGRTKKNMEYAQMRLSNNTQARQMSIQASLVHNYASKNREGLLEYSKPYEISEMSNSRSRVNTVAPTLTTFGFFSLPKGQYFLVNVSGSYTHNNNSTAYEANGDGLSSTSREDYYNLFTNLTYGKSFKHSNSLQLSIVESYNNSSINYGGTYTSWQHLWNSETLFLAEYTHKLKQFVLRVRPGLTLRYSRVNGYKMETEVGPRLYVEGIYRPTQLQQIKLSAAFGNGAVSLSQRSSAEVPVDFLMVSRGNPYLKPYTLLQNYNLNYSLQFSKFNLGANVSYDRFTDAAIMDYFQENDKIVRTYFSGNTSRLTNSLSLSWNAAKQFRVNISGTHRYGRRETTRSYQLNTLGGSISANYYLKEFNLNVSANTPRKTMESWGYSKTPATYSFTLNWNHKNWSASAWVTNPFNHIKTTSRFSTPGYDSYARTVKTRSGFVKLTYTFDYGKKKIANTGVERVNTRTNTEILE